MSENTIIKKREALDIKDTWATEDMFASDEAWEQALTDLQNDKEKLVGFCGKLGCNAETLFDYLQLMEQSNERASLLANYCMRKGDEDTRNAIYQSMTGKFMSVIVDMGAATSFETPEILSVSDKLLDSFYQQMRALKPQGSGSVCRLKNLYQATN